MKNQYLKLSAILKKWHLKWKLMNLRFYLGATDDLDWRQFQNLESKKYPAQLRSEDK